MNNYSIIAWLPGECVFYAKNNNGETGLLSLNGFAETPDFFALSAIYKWGFRDLRSLKIQANIKHLANLYNHLSETIG